MKHARMLFALSRAASLSLASVACHSSESSPPPSTPPDMATASKAVEPAQSAPKPTQPLDGDSFESHTTAVESEVGVLGHTNPWAGEYFYGDGMGMNVSFRVAPTSSFEFIWIGCTGVWGRNWGEVAERDGLLALTFQWPHERKVPYGFDAAFIPVKWGERRYLIVPSEMKRFCNAINKGEEPRATGNGYFLLRRDKGEQPPTTRPELPREFASMVLDAPLHGKVVEVKRSVVEPRNGEPCRVTIVALDIGSKNGAWEGMELFLGDSIYGNSMTVTKCDDTRCEAEHRTHDIDAPLPAVGVKLTTRPEDE